MKQIKVGRVNRPPETRRMIEKAFRLNRYVKVTYREKNTNQVFAVGGQVSYCGGLSFEVIAGPGLKKEIDFSWVKSLNIVKRKHSPIHYFDLLGEPAG